MSMTLALLRHGETPWSRDKRVQGRTDISLSDAGQAALAARRVPAACATMRVLSSPLARCTQSAQQLRLSPVGIEPRLAEMTWGQWEGRRLPELRAELGDAMVQNEARGWDFQPPDGESPRLVWARIRPWLVEVAGSGQATLALTHRGVIRVVFATATGWDMLGKPPAKLDWNAVHLFTLTEDGMPSVQQLNLPLEPAGGVPGAP